MAPPTAEKQPTNSAKRQPKTINLETLMKISKAKQMSKGSHHPSENLAFLQKPGEDSDVPYISDNSNM